MKTIKKGESVKKAIFIFMCVLFLILVSPKKFHAAKSGENDFSGNVNHVRSQSIINHKSESRSPIPDRKEPALEDQLSHVTPPGTKTLTGIEIVGPSSLSENSHADYSARAIFSDGSTQYVTTSAKWNEDSNWGDMDSIRRYRLKAKAVPSDQPITIISSYEYNGVKKSACMEVNIKNIKPTYEVNLNNTTNGGGTLGPILKLKASVSGTNLLLTLTKKDGTPWSKPGTVYFNAGADQTNGALREAVQIAVGKRWATYTYNLTEHPGYPKKFYVRFKGVKGHAWVGPITVYER